MTQLNAVFAQRIAETDLRLDRKSEILCALFPEFVERDTRSSFLTVHDGVLIVHGFPGSSWDRSGVIASVAERTRVVAADMLGYGQSDKPVDGMMAQIAENDGGRLLSRINRYQLERRVNLERWTEGLTKFSAPEFLFWGGREPLGNDFSSRSIGPVYHRPTLAIVVFPDLDRPEQRSNVNNFFDNF
jgi:hypothetical protein